MRPLHSVVMGAIVFGLAAAGCGGAIPSSNGGPASLKMTASNQGRFLVDAQGRSLYLFEKDAKGESYCGGACAAVWPPLETNSKPHASGGLAASAVTTIKRDDGDMQVTYHGHPLYYYAADASTPGKTRGQSVEQFGAEWYLVNASGNPVESKNSSYSKSTPNSGSNSGGGGYGG